MRHNKKFNHLGRTASHRSAMLANMAISLIMHKRITTTVAKAKALKKYVEPLITRSKDDSTNLSFLSWMRIWQRHPLPRRKLHAVHVSQQSQKKLLLKRLPQQKQRLP